MLIYHSFDIFQNIVNANSPMLKKSNIGENYELTSLITTIFVTKFAVFEIHKTASLDILPVAT